MQAVDTMVQPILAGERASRLSMTYEDFLDSEWEARRTGWTGP